MLPAILGGCGLGVPEKGLLSNDNVIPPNASPEGMFEQNLVAHIRCEIRNGLWKAHLLPNVPWLKDYGATVLLKLTAEEQSAVTPGATFLTPLVNAQTFTFGLGASSTAHATRTETIQFTYANSELLKEAEKDLKAGITGCEGYQRGIMVEGDLKIAQFIYDKAVVAGAAGEATTKSIITPAYSQFQEEITFVTSFGGNVTPTWKLARVAVNPNSPLFAATRTNTNYMLITLGPVAQGAKGNMQAQLTADTRLLHNATLIGSSAGTSVQSSSLSR